MARGNSRTATYEQAWERRIKCRSSCRPLQTFAARRTSQPKVTFGSSTFSWMRRDASKNKDLVICLGTTGQCG
jgi:hypothetical protein